MTGNRVSAATSHRVNDFEPFRVQRDARTGVRASDAGKWVTGALMYDERQQ